jgi:hypothetical protein
MHQLLSTAVDWAAGVGLLLQQRQQQQQQTACYSFLVASVCLLCRGRLGYAAESALLLLLLDAVKAPDEFLLQLQQGMPVLAAAAAAVPGSAGAGSSGSSSGASAGRVVAQFEKQYAYLSSWVERRNAGMVQQQLAKLVDLLGKAGVAEAEQR